MKAFWRKASAAPGGPSARLASIHVERAGRCAVSGWAVDADGGDGELQVLIGGRLVDIPVRRLARPDVLAHLGIESIDAARRPGFEFGFDATSWGRWAVRGSSLAIELRLGDSTVVPLALSLDEDELDRWARELLTADAQVQDDDWPRLSTFLARAPERWGWVREEWARQGGAPGARVRAALESVDGVVLSGWASDPIGREETFAVRVGDCLLHPLVARHDREDVRQLLPDVAGPAGFELLLPVALWRAVPQGAEALVDVLVNGRPLTQVPLRLEPRGLGQQLIDAVHATGSLQGVERLAARDRSALLLEHVLAAGAFAGLSADDQHVLRQWAGDKAVEFGWTNPTSPQEAVTVDDGTLVPSQQEFSASLWALQRCFNRELAGVTPTGPNLLAALEAVLGAVEARDAADIVRVRFVVMMIPAFCAVGSLDMLRPLIDDADVRRLAHADGTWELSLILPVVLMDELADGRLAQSCLLLERIVRGLPAGWLNTEVFPEAVARIRAAIDSDVLEGHELRRFVTAMLGVYEGVGGSPWSRLHDRHLVDAMVGLVKLQPYLDETTSAQVFAAAAKFYATTAPFWTALVGDGLPAALGPVHRAYEAWCREAGRDQDPSPSAWMALSDLRRLGAVEADWLGRHLSVRVPTAKDATSSATGLPEIDLLRIDPDAAAHSDAWRDVAPVPSVSLREVRRRAQARLSMWREAAARGDLAGLRALWHEARPDWLVLAAEPARFVGLLLLSKAWARLADLDKGEAGTTASAKNLRQVIGQSIEIAVRRALDIIERQRERFSVPPAALLACLDWMAQGGAEAPAHWDGLVEQAELHLRAGWGQTVGAARTKLPRPADRWCASLPGLSLLVVVRLSDRAGGEFRARRLTASWAQDLERHEAAWCLWWPDNASVREGAPGDPAHLLGGDRLALLAWLVRHTSFGHFLFVDDDMYLAADAFHIESGALGEHYHGAVRCESVELPGPPGSLSFVDPTQGMTLSRHAALLATQLARTRAGARVLLAHRDDGHRLAQLLALAHVAPSADGHFVHLRRAPQAGEPDTRFHNLWLPGPGLATVLTTLDDGEEVAEVLAPSQAGRAWPPRIWPLDLLPRLPGGSLPAQQLIRLSRAPEADDASPCVIAVARNERVLLPHFLAHYRGLGVKRFFVADNLSTDGSREFLMAQPDVCVYSVDTAYRDSHYGVAWQMALLAEHAQQRWAVVADVDEFLVWPGCEEESLAALCGRLDADHADAVMALMVDMYPVGALDEADFERGRPFDEACYFDAWPCLPWRLGSGQYSNGPTFVSAVRHRMLPDSPPNHYTAQKLPLLRYHAGVRFSEGLHYAAGLRPARQPVFLAHFKYHKGFRAKVEEEIARKQHYNDAEEYRKYRALWTEARGMMFDPSVSRRYVDSHSFADIPWN